MTTDNPLFMLQAANGTPTGVADAAHIATEGNRLAWGLAANAGDPGELERLLHGFIERTDEALLLPELVGALLVMTTLALEPALQVADRSRVPLRAEFAHAFGTIEKLIPPQGSNRG